MLTFVEESEVSRLIGGVCEAVVGTLYGDEHFARGAGLIVPDFDAARMRELKALYIDENRLEKVIFFNDGKMIITTDVELKRLIKKRYQRISE